LPVVRKSGLATALAGLLALSACGDSNDDGDGAADSGRPEATGAGRCIELWNGEASPDLRAKASLSHRGDTGEADILVGTYTGEEFSATGQSFDEAGGTTSADVSVSRGDCVALDLTADDSETNWVMVLAKSGSEAGRSWYFLDETANHPLAKPPQPLDRPARAGLVGFGEEAKLSTDGP
jgi:major membrane immunogen (membrane-anchored lipoprotein)